MIRWLLDAADRYEHQPVSRHQPVDYNIYSKSCHKLWNHCNYSSVISGLEVCFSHHLAGPATYDFMMYFLTDTLNINSYWHTWIKDANITVWRCEKSWMQPSCLIMCCKAYVWCRYSRFPQPGCCQRGEHTTLHGGFFGIITSLLPCCPLHRLQY